MRRSIRTGSAAAPAVAFVLLLILPAPLLATDLFEPTRRVLTEREARLPEVRDPIERAALLLETGRHEEAAALVPVLLDAGDAGIVKAAEVFFAVRDFNRLAPLMERFVVAPLLDDPDARIHFYHWLFLREDRPDVERLVDVRLRADSTSFVDLLAAGRLRYSLLENEPAGEIFARALAASAAAADSAEALHGLAQVAYRKRDFDRGLSLLAAAIRLDPLDPDRLMTLGHLLIRLGRIDEAIDAFELVVRLAPDHEDGHYMLGNGYARKNYTQIYAAYPEAFADSAGRAALASADSLLNAGDPDAARASYLAIRDRHPGWTDLLVRLGSLDFAQGRFGGARVRFKEALAICPEYGRAHNGLAKAIEGQQLAIEIHRSEYEEVHGSLPMPEIPGIERFVLNWDSLSDRHKKRVALSIEPWKRFIPVLLEGGATYYIKPLYELLSETPDQETLHDLRISYDARLWDDVRGCGGHHTVTGIEDVERTILYRYDTVLHELTHQVHGILPADRGRQIEELYRRTKERDQETRDAFLSRYAGGSVWEYFAEGANALASPRWDRYDTREIVRERLEVYDPILMRLVRELMTEAEVESCYAVAYVNRGYDSIERAAVPEAIDLFRKALERLPGEENALGALVYALQLADSAESAVRLAGTGVETHPESGDLAVTMAGALWHAGRPLPDAVDSLARARGRVRREDRYRIDLALGRFRWILGDAPDAIALYRAVLEDHPENPAALWGLASSHALAGDWEEAWELYDRTVRERTGEAGLRVAFARDLLLAGETERAREQIDAALLLDPDDPDARAMEAWTLLAADRPDSARALAYHVLEDAPWCDLALVVKARAELAAGDPERAEATLDPLKERLARAAPPEYIYRTKWGRYEEVHTLPSVLRRLIPKVAGEGTEGVNQE